MGIDAVVNLMTYMAKNYNIELYFFFADDIDFENNSINATFIEGKTQTPKTIPFPRIIFNIPEAVVGEANNKLKLRLEKEGCYFVRPVLFIDKHKTHEIISNSEFKECLIETNTLKDLEHFLALLKQHNHDVVVKPTVGGGGAGVTRITLDGGQYVVRLKNVKFFLKTLEELQSYYNKNFTQRQYVLQPYIISRTTYGNAFDIRIHVFRAPEGKFKLILYPRISNNPDDFISNMHAGGYTANIYNFLKWEFGADWKKIWDKLNYIGNEFPKYFLASFDEKIFALGIDIGIQQRGNSYEIKFFEINSRSPGMGFIEMQSAFACLEYLQYLGECLANGTWENHK